MGLRRRKATEPEPDAYEEFIRAKAITAAQAGIEVGPDDVHPALFPHQADMVRWAAAGGWRAIFAAFGLGKSLMRLALLELIRRVEGGPVLIVVPLGVRQEFARGVLGRADAVAVAWGSTCPRSLLHTARQRRQVVLNLCRDLGRAVLCLGVTADGQPRHPSRLGNDVRLEPLPAAAPTGSPT